MSTGVIEAPTVEPTSTTTDKENAKHIVDQDKSGYTITEAIVMGYEVEALCGHIFIPSRDDAALPACRACLSIKENYGGSFGH